MTTIKKILFLLLFYFMFLYIYTWRNILVLKNNDFDEKNLYKDEIKTGDIFLLGNKKKYKILGDSVFMIQFVHPSIAVWDNFQLYILEFAIYPDREGFIKIPFEKWLNYNKNKRILRSELKILEETCEDREILKSKMLEFYEKNRENINSKNKDFDLSWLRFLFRTKSDLNIDSISCTEVLSDLIYYSGIAKKDKGISYYHQSDFVSLNGFSLNKKFSYPVNYLCKFQHLMKKYI